MKFSLTIGLAVLTLGINAKELKANLIQKSSTVTGQTAGKADPEQVESDTSDENFINICDGKTLTDGKQIEAGSCNGIPMGDIPSKNNMVSSIITFPKTGEPVKAGQSFDIKVKMTNIVTGFFTNPLETYYAAPQKLQGGKVVGHTHVTVQDMGNTMNPDTPLPPEKFSFFKGINAKADANGVVSATVTDGLPAGNYRVCTLTSAANHQSVIMPVAQRGAQDDCTKFEVTAAGGGGGGGGGENDATDKKANNGNKNKDDDDDDNDKSDNADKNKNGDNKNANANDADKKASANDADKNKNGGGNNPNPNDADKKASANDADKNKKGDNKNANANDADKKASANNADQSKTGGGNNDKNSDASKAKANVDKNDKNDKNDDDDDEEEEDDKNDKNDKNDKENKARSNIARDSERDDDNDKPKAADNESKKSAIADTESAGRSGKASVVDCQTLNRRAITKNIEKTANLEGGNEIKKDMRNQKRFSRVFIS